MGLSELACHVLYKQPRVTKHIVRLQEEGLVKKSIRLEDRRNLHLYLTAKGRRLVEPLIKKAVRHESGALSALSKSESRQFRKTLKKLIASFDETSTPV